jgi:hypothetical protein
VSDLQFDHLSYATVVAKCLPLVDTAPALAPSRIRLLVAYPAISWILQWTTNSSTLSILRERYSGRIVKAFRRAKYKSFGFFGWRSLQRNLQQTSLALVNHRVPIRDPSPVPVLLVDQGRPSDVKYALSSCLCENPSDLGPDRRGPIATAAQTSIIRTCWHGNETRTFFQNRFWFRRRHIPSQASIEPADEHPRAEVSSAMAGNSRAFSRRHVPFSPGHPQQQTNVPALPRQLSRHVTGRVFVPVARRISNAWLSPQSLPYSRSW